MVHPENIIKTEKYTGTPIPNHKCNTTSLSRRPKVECEHLEMQSLGNFFKVFIYICQKLMNCDSTYIYSPEYHSK